MHANGPKPADQRPPGGFVKGVDDCAQQRVASQMMRRANEMGRAPDYVLNGGDNFYWQGLDMKCGSPASQIVENGQFAFVFEAMYHGPGLDGKPWLGVLGNHDYGGFLFDKGWDQNIAYTWKEGGRWMTPAQYWRTKVHYPGFSVDYFFLDDNEIEAKEPDWDADHNICSSQHNEEDAGCGVEGPKDVWDCPGWFSRLWEEQVPWFEEAIGASTADWQIVVAHFPPSYRPEIWTVWAKQYGIDLFVSGHLHQNEFHYMEPENFIKPSAWIIAGGGGGITSESTPDLDGNDDQYGFFELTLTRDAIEVQGISHGGAIRVLAFVTPRWRNDEEPVAEKEAQIDQLEATRHMVGGAQSNEDHIAMFKK